MINDCLLIEQYFSINKTYYIYAYCIYRSDLLFTRIGLWTRLQIYDSALSYSLLILERIDGELSNF